MSTPAWVWDMLIAVQKYADEHPTLYRQAVGGDDRYVPTECLDGIVERLVPRDVWEIAKAIAEDRARREAS